MTIAIIKRVAPPIIRPGENTLDARRWATASAASAATALGAEVAAVAARDAARAVANYFATLAAGIAGTAVGALFTSDEEGVLAWYRHTSGSPFYEFVQPVNRGDAVTLDMFYRPAHGLNWQPAIQAGINFAVTYGVPKLLRGLLSSSSIQVWTPVRSADPDTYVVGDGNPIVIEGDVEIDLGGVELDFRSPTGNAVRTQTVMGKPWMGGGIIYNGPDVTKARLKGIKLKGGGEIAYDSGDAELLDKGIFVHNAICPNLKEIDLRDLGVRDFCAEGITGGDSGGGGYGNIEVYAENITISGSPISGWNIQAAAKLTAINVDASFCYSPAEVLSGKGHTYIGCRFADAKPGSGAVFFGGPSPTFAAYYPYDFATRDESESPPFVNFIDTRFERCNVNFGSWIRGNLVLVDCSAGGLYNVGLRDIYLNIEHWTDQGSPNAFYIDGPQTDTTQGVGGTSQSWPIGEYFPRPKNIEVDVKLRRTQVAVRDGNYADGVQIGPGGGLGAGLLDGSSITFRISGEGRYPWLIAGPVDPVAGFELPLMIAKPEDWRGFAAGGGPAETFGGVTLPSSKTLSIVSSVLGLYPPSAGVCILDFDDTIIYQDTQEFCTLCVAPVNTTDHIMIFPKNTATILNSVEISQRKLGEQIRWRYNKATVVNSGGTPKWSAVEVVAQGGDIPVFFNPDDKSADVTLSGSNHTAEGTSGAHWDSVRANRHRDSGRYYAEGTVVAVGGGVRLGLANSSFTLAANYLGSANSVTFESGGHIVVGNANVVTLDAATTSDVIRMAWDHDKMLLWVAVNDGDWNGDPTADPEHSLGGYDWSALGTKDMYPAFSGFNGGKLTINCGATAFAKAQPIGFRAANSEF